MSLIFRTFYKSYPRVFCKSFHSSSSLQSDGFNQKWFEMRGFYKYGLLEDDLECEFYADVAEAVRRLPEEVRMKRIHRAIRAQQAFVGHTYLPEDQWTKFEDNHFYLQPYLREVRQEKEEQQEWEANH